MHFFYKERLSFNIFFSFILIAGIVFLSPLQLISVETISPKTDSNDSLVEKASLLLKRSDKIFDSKPFEAKSYVFEAILLADRINSDSIFAKANLNAGGIYLNLNNTDSAHYHLRKAEKYAANLNNILLSYRIYNELGRFHQVTRNLDSAQYLFEKCLQIANTLKDTMFIAGAYNNLGLNADNKGDLKKAYEYYMLALKSFESINDRQHAAIVLNNLGLIVHGLGESEKAIDFVSRAIIINQELDRHFHLSMNYGNLGIYYSKLSQDEQAKEAYEKSLQIAIEHNLTLDQARAYLNIGYIYANDKNFIRAEENFTKSLELCQKHNIVYGVILSNSALGSLYQDKMDYAKAELFFMKALILAEESAHTVVMKNLYQQLSKVYESKGAYKLALEYSDKYINLSDSLSILDNKIAILDLQTKYETERKDLENRNLKAENEIKNQIIKNQRLTNIVVIFILFTLVVFTLMILKSRRKLNAANLKLNELNNQVLAQNKSLKELNQTKNKLFSVIGHDLKSPFNSLLGFLQILIDDFESIKEAEKKKILETLYLQSNNTYAMLENLLQWALSQQGQIKYTPQIVDFHNVIQTEVLFLGSRAEKKKISIKNDVKHRTNIWADKNMVQTIFRNIINNAIKFSDVGGCINIESSENDGYTFFHVTDTGIGMTQETIDTLLSENIFYTTDGTQNEKGTGLGLMIVKDFTALNHAELSIQSTPDVGSVFTLKFSSDHPFSV
jgi:signal transduction histidine kinase